MQSMLARCLVSTRVGQVGPKVVAKTKRKKTKGGRGCDAYAAHSTSAAPGPRRRQPRRGRSTGVAKSERAPPVCCHFPVPNRLYENSSTQLTAKQTAARHSSQPAVMGTSELRSEALQRMEEAASSRHVERERRIQQYHFPSEFGAL